MNSVLIITIFGASLVLVAATIIIFSVTTTEKQQPLPPPHPPRPNPITPNNNYHKPSPHEMDLNNGRRWIFSANYDRARRANSKGAVNIIKNSNNTLGIASWAPNEATNKFYVKRFANDQIEIMDYDDAAANNYNMCYGADMSNKQIKKMPCTNSNTRWSYSPKFQFVCPGCEDAQLPSKIELAENKNAFIRWDSNNKLAVDTTPVEDTKDALFRISYYG